MGEGKNPTQQHLIKLASIANIKKQEALNIIDEVKLAVDKWDVFAKDAGVTLSSQKVIKRKLK